MYTKGEEIIDFFELVARPRFINSGEVPRHFFQTLQCDSANIFSSEGYPSKGQHQRERGHETERE